MFQRLTPIKVTTRIGTPHINNSRTRFDSQFGRYLPVGLLRRYLHRIHGVATRTGTTAIIVRRVTSLRCRNCSAATGPIGCRKDSAMARVKGGSVIAKKTPIFVCQLCPGLTSENWLLGKKE